MRKFRIQDASAYLPMCGRGCIVLQSASAESAYPTTIRSTAWFPPQSLDADLDEAQQDPRFLVQMDFLLRAFESYVHLFHWESGCDESQ